PLVVGPLRVEPDRSSYDGIVDGFGQLLPGDWPEKVSSVEMLRAKGAEENRALAQWLADLPRRDRFGGLLDTGGFRATGFFRTGWRGSFGGVECRMLLIRDLSRQWMRWREALPNGFGATLGWSAISLTTSCPGGVAGRVTHGNITLSRSIPSLSVPIAQRN